VNVPRTSNTRQGQDVKPETKERSNENAIDPAEVDLDEVQIVSLPDSDLPKHSTLSAPQWASHRSPLVHPLDYFTTPPIRHGLPTNPCQNPAYLKSFR